jgi:hypothetical protein
MTFKMQIEQANAAKATAAENAAEQRTNKAEELAAIADRLETHLIEQKPAEVGLEMQRSGSRVRLKSTDYTIVIDAGFEEYTGTVLGGSPPQTIRGSRQRMATLDDVDAYIVAILQGS